VDLEDLSLPGASAAARLAFDFPSGQELVLADREGERLSSDEALRTVVAQAETVYVRLADSALHDFERRIDQLQHLHIGFLCDQLATFRQEHADFRTELKGVRVAVDQEQAARDVSADAVQRELASMRVVHERQLHKTSERLEALEVAMLETGRGAHEEALAREQAGQEALRQLRELRETVTAEASAREHAGERLRLEIEGLRRTLALEVGDREEAELRAERGLQALRTALSDAADSQARECEELRRHLLDARQAAGVEQRERIAADTDLAGSVKELQTALQNELRDRASEDAKGAARCREAETTIEAEKLAREQAVAELTQQLSVAVESIQEEQALRSSEDVELSQMLEALRRSVDEVRRRAEEAERAVARMAPAADLAQAIEALRRNADEAQRAAGRTAQELAERFEEEARAHRAEATEWLQRLAEERGARQQEEARAGGTLAALQEGLAVEQRERAAVDGELAAAIKEARALVDREVQARERGDLAISRGTEAAREAAEEALQQQGLLEQRLQQLAPGEGQPDGGAGRDGPLQALAEEVHGDLAALREGLARVVEAVQQERRSRSEGDSKLREDCREAIQKEINARLERDSRIREDIEAEGRLRQEAVEVIQLAIEECRQGLETHTHELQVDDSPMDSAGMVILPGR